MGEKKIFGSVLGIGKGEYEQIDSFPKIIKKGEILVHEKECKKSIKYISWYMGKNRIPSIDIKEIPK